MEVETSMEIEWLILADAAETVAGKLYMIGGGWDRLIIHQSFPHRQKVAIAVAIRVPWSMTNEKHTLRLVVITTDGQELGGIDAQFEAGRPAGGAVGQPQRAQFAANFDLEFRGPGSYAVSGSIDGTRVRDYPFTVAAGPGAQAKDEP